MKVTVTKIKNNLHYLENIDIDFNNFEKIVEKLKEQDVHVYQSDIDKYKYLKQFGNINLN